MLSKPMTIGGLFDYSFRLFRGNLHNLIIISLVLIIADVFFLLASLGEELFYISAINMNGLAILWLLISALIIYPICAGMIVKDTFYRIEAKKLTLTELLRESAANLGKYIISMICLALIVMSIMGVIYFILDFFHMALIDLVINMYEESFPPDEYLMGMRIVFYAGVLLMYFMAFFFSCWGLIIFPIMEQEKLYGFTAVFRALNIIYRKFWRLLGTVIILGLLIMVATLMIVGIIVFINELYLDVFSFFESIGNLITAIFNIIYSFAAPFIMILVIIVYKDICFRLEGTDLRLDSNNGDESKEG